jgi:ubiquinone/menaquinone biosynthesis C-methylase UbiE
MGIDYTSVTEMAGDEVSGEQLERLCHRYYWSGEYCQGREVLEVACGTGPGLGYLAKRSKSLCAGDYTRSILAVTRKHYGNRIPLLQFDAQEMPFEDASMEVIIIFEAIYYISNIGRFVADCRRVLRPGGQIIIATANKDLFDFNPSPFSCEYLGVIELGEVFSIHNFSAEYFGYLSVKDVSWRQRVLRPIKKMAIALRLIPKTTHGKKWLKKIIFGNLTYMPAEVEDDAMKYQEPVSLPAGQADTEHKVIYCVATIND